MVLSSELWFGKPVAYEIDESCRFNSADSAYLTQTPGGTASSARLGTLSVWVKRAALGTQQAIINQQRTSDTYDALSIVFKTDNTLQFAIEGASAATVMKRVTTQVFRDPSAWYHFVFAWDSNQTDDTSCAIYVNGEAITAFGTKTNPGSAQDLQFLNTSKAVWVGRSSSGSNLCDVYMSEMAVIDGSKLAASSFGETNSDTGQWVPTDITGLTYGNEGWLFAFQDSSALGDDTSGNGNDFTSSGLAAADQVVDTPSDNYCTLNPLRPPNTNLTFSEGNLSVIASSGFNTYQATFQIPATEKWYCEIVAVGGDQPISGTANWDGTIGIGTVAADGSPTGESTNWMWGNANTTAAGTKSNGSNITLVPASSLTDGSVVMMAIDMDNSKIWWGVDGSWMGTASGDNDGNPATGANPAYANLSGDLFPTGSCHIDPQYWNFGQLGFAHTPPTGFAGLYWSQLDDPTIADPSGSFQTTLYTGDGASSLAVNQGGNSTFSPDFVWIKNRDATDNHCWFDSVRGATELISSNNTDAESTDADTLTAFDSDGFTVGADVKVNTNTEKYVGWQWLEDTTAAFDMVTYTGTGSTRTVSHNLGVKPDLMIFKRRDGTQNWQVYHSAITAYYKLFLDLALAKVDDTDSFNDTEPTSSVFTVKSDGTVNGTDQTYIAYLFAGVEGFSKISSYVGNASADGPFVWCGFRPATIIFKNASASAAWEIFDNKRDGYNNPNRRLYPNEPDAEEAASDRVALLSNGFKIITSGGSNVNGDGNTIVFAAWADTPFKTATAR